MVEVTKRRSGPMIEKKVSYDFVRGLTGEIR